MQDLNFNYIYMYTTAIISFTFRHFLCDYKCKKNESLKNKEINMQSKKN